jgi:hypothetical protein
MPTLEGLNPDFADLLVLLTDGGVDFLVVGAYALALHAHAPFLRWNRDRATGNATERTAIA